MCVCVRAALIGSSPYYPSELSASLFAVFWWSVSPDFSVSACEPFWVVWFLGNLWESVVHFAAIYVLCIRREVLCAIFTSLRLLNSCICVTTIPIFELEAHARDPSCNTNLEPQAIQLTPHGVLLCVWSSLDPADIHRNLSEFRPGVRLSVAKNLAREQDVYCHYPAGAPVVDIGR